MLTAGALGAVIGALLGAFIGWTVALSDTRVRTADACYHKLPHTPPQCAWCLRKKVRVEVIRLTNSPPPPACSHTSPIGSTTSQPVAPVGRRSPRRNLPAPHCALIGAV